MLEGQKEFAEAWNFGPTPDDNRTVSEVLTHMQSFWPELAWNVSAAPQPHEAQLLYLDCAKSRAQLRWAPVWSLEEGLAMTADWYRNYHASGKTVTVDQLARYLEAACAAGSDWIK